MADCNKVADDCSMEDTSSEIHLRKRPSRQKNAHPTLPTLRVVFCLRYGSKSTGKFHITLVSEHLGQSVVAKEQTDNIAMKPKSYSIALNWSIVDVMHMDPSAIWRFRTEART
jgi:hypothetical protein